MARGNYSDRVKDYRKALGGRGMGSFLERRRKLIGHSGGQLEQFADAEATQTPEIELLVVETLVEAALDHDTDEGAVRAIGKAKKRLDKLQETMQFASRALAVENLRASVLGIYMPFFGSLALSDSLPPQALSEKIYEHTATLSGNVGQNWDDLKSQNDKSAVNGFASEFLGLALLQRFATTEIADATWWPAPALVTDSHLGRARNANGCTNRDINVFTTVDHVERSDYDLSYSVEIKRNKTAVDYATKRHGSYDDTITVVNIFDQVLAGADEGRDVYVPQALRLISEDAAGTGDARGRAILAVVQDRMVDAIE